MSDPRQKDFDERHTKLPTVTALTKREYFAAMAMQGLMAVPYKGDFDSNYASSAAAAKLAVTMADELLKQLEK